MNAKKSSHPIAKDKVSAVQERLTQYFGMVVRLRVTWEVCPIVVTLVKVQYLGLPYLEVRMPGDPRPVFIKLSEVMEMVIG